MHRYAHRSRTGGANGVSGASGMTQEKQARSAHPSEGGVLRLPVTNVVRDMCSVTGVPMFVIVKVDGSVAWRRVGMCDLAALEAGVRLAI